MNILSTYLYIYGRPLSGYLAAKYYFTLFRVRKRSPSLQAEAFLCNYGCVLTESWTGHPRANARGHARKVRWLRPNAGRSKLRTRQYIPSAPLPAFWVFPDRFRKRVRTHPRIGPGLSPGPHRFCAARIRLLLGGPYFHQ